MASTLPTTITPLISITSLQAYLNEISESLAQARQAVDRFRRALIESLDRLGPTIDVPKGYESSHHATLRAQKTILKELSEELDALERWLDALEGLVQRYLEDSTNTASTTTTTTAVTNEKQSQERALYGSRARYVVVVLLLSASLLTTLFALFFVSTQK